MNWKTLTFESPFSEGAVCKAVAETSDGAGVLFRCPATGRDFVVTYEAQAQEKEKAQAQAQADKAQ